MQTLVSIQVGKPKEMDADPSLPLSSKPWRSAIFKSAVAGDVAVGREGIEGDKQADLKNHGGLDKAICVYPAQHLPYWQEQLNRPDFGFGAFGENFSVAGLNESSVGIGDRWQIGTAVFEVTQPRQPCWKLARRWQNKSLTTQSIDTGKTGWYLRVIQTGMVSSGLPIDVTPVADAAEARFSITEANDLFYRIQSKTKTIQQLIEVKQLSAAWRSALQKKLKTA